MRTTFESLANSDIASGSKPTAVVITNPGTRELSRTLNGLFITDPDNGELTIILDQTTKQFQLWRFHIGTGNILFDGNRHYRIDDISFFTRPKYPIAKVSVVDPRFPEAKLLDEISKLENHRRFGIS